MLNLQALDAISFTKGCYIGQETVARLKYRGGNKRAAYILSAETDETPVAAVLKVLFQHRVGGRCAATEKCIVAYDKHKRCAWHQMG